MSEAEAIISEFVAETTENLGQLEVDLVDLEHAPTDRQLISGIFRTFHTVKGTCGFLGLNRLEALAHAGESLLSRLREGSTGDVDRVIDLLLRVVDVLRLILAEISVSGSDDVEVEAVEAVIAEIADFLSTTSVDEPKSGKGTPAQSDHDDDSANLAQQIDLTANQAAPDETVRVNVGVLDALMRQVGELVLSRNRLGRIAAEHHDQELVALTSTVRGVVNELQTSVMQTRMQPVSQAWQQIPRLVRDLSSNLGKTVELQTSGGETELDRALIEVIKDPLTHLIRNAIDHGIEAPDERREAGKPDSGVLTMRAYPRGGRLVIDVTDDGAGVDIEAIAQQAVARAFLTTDEVANASESELLQVLFRPGFSTAAEVSHVSGRGVGMDVVKSAVDSVRGSVEILSNPGQGTTFRLAVPLTLVVTPSVTVEVAGQRFAIPQADIRELVRVDGRTNLIENISGSPVFRLRDRLIPVVVMTELLGLNEPREPLAGTIAVMRVGRELLGILVDSVLDSEEILVEPLDQRIGELDAYIGAAILADGRVSLVLNLHAIAARAAYQTDVLVESAAERDDALSAQTSAPLTSSSQFVLALVNDRRRIALPMSDITRLAQLPAGTIEQVGSREVAQYRGRVMTILRLGRYLDRRSSDANQPTQLTRSLPVIVCRRGTRVVGFLVDEIVDVASHATEVDVDADDERISGALMIEQRVTEVLDVARALTAADPEFFDELPVQTDGTQSEVA